MKLEIEDEEKYTSRLNGMYQRLPNYPIDIPDDTFDFYMTNSISRVDYSREFYDEDTKPSMLLNLDNQNRRRPPSFDTDFHDDEPPFKKLLLRDDRDEMIDLDGMRKKPIEEWEKSDTENWLICKGGELGQTYKHMSPCLSMPGRDLLLLSRQDFASHDRTIGEKLYDSLQMERESKNFLPPFGSLKSSSDDETSIGSANHYSDGESYNGIMDSVKKRPPGRPRILDPRRKVAKEKLWEFIRNLLLNPKYCPQWICWDNYEKKRFRFVQSDSVAKLWGARKNNKNMTYEKFSRAMRYYYPKKIFVPVHGRRLVYEFGQKATGLETENPNFASNYYGDTVRSRDFINYNHNN